MYRSPLKDHIVAGLVRRVQETLPNTWSTLSDQVASVTRKLVDGYAEIKGDSTERRKEYFRAVMGRLRDQTDKKSHLPKKLAPIPPGYRPPYRDD